MMSEAAEFTVVMSVTAEFTFVVLLRQRSVGSYSFTLLGCHTLQALVTCFALCHIVLDELLYFRFLTGVSLAMVSLAYFS